MSVLFKSSVGCYISHSALIKTYYTEISNSNLCFYLKPQLFDISVPYKPTTKRQNKQQHDYCNNDEFEMEVKHVEELYCKFCDEMPLEFIENNHNKRTNEEALKIANLIYNESGDFPINLNGGNNSNGAIIQKLDNSLFLFPNNCRFFSRDIIEIQKYIVEKYDLILLDPPWWNKCIRRKRKYSNQGYNMMYDDDLKQLPIEHYLETNGLIVVWCTNSSQHLNSLINDIFPKWGIKFIGKWYWVKVTTNLKPICEFSKPPRKQPFEQIIFGTRTTRQYRNPNSDQLVISIPSAIHSHKPPLTELLKEYLPKEPKCLELFARYLLPNWTSYGKEVLRLQHESLYSKLIKN